MTRIVLSLVLAAIISVGGATAQQRATWIQIEAHPSLSNAQDSIRGYAARLQDVNGFSLASGWYAIALGPYSSDEARYILGNLRNARMIPRDSYVAESSDYRQQFWPVGANFLKQPPLSAPSVVENPEPDTETAALEPEPTPEPEPELEPADETPREARASERDLTKEQRAELQTALKWAGFYSGTIDASFGRGTRGSMSRWQEANNFEPTGILTTRQRAELLRQYNAVLEGMDLQLVREDKMGVEIKLPLGAVTFDKYEAPFAHFKRTGDIEAHALLISQEGDSGTLAGLYGIMQTLEIVPEIGPRNLEEDTFTLIGESAMSVSHTQAWLQDGAIKGFTLVWPAGDEERRRRVLGEIQASFQPIDGVLDAAAGSTEDQSIDLISGLEIRKPKLSRSGFYVDQDGTVVTTTEVLQSCSKITIDQDFEAEVTVTDDTLGIAVLRPKESLVPVAVAAFQQAIPRLQSDVAVAGYSYGGVLGAPTLTFGQLADVRGLNGEENLKRLALTALDGDVGGPVLDTGGAVLGVLLSSDQNGRKLPEGVSFAAGADAILSMLKDAEITPAATTDLNQMAPEVLSSRAADMTVLVSCWE